MKRLIAMGAAAMIATAAPAFAQEDAAAPPAGTYNLDKNHAYLTWNVSHNGLSTYTGAFTDFDATVEFDPATPAASTLNVTINPAAIETNYPIEPKGDEWEDELANDDKFMNADTHPEITFVATAVETTSDTTGTVTGDLTFLGQTKPVTLNVTYNGFADLPWMEGRGLIGFSAEGIVTRSEFGMSALLPNISDDVTIKFSGEFVQAAE